MLVVCLSLSEMGMANGFQLLVVHQPGVSCKAAIAYPVKE